MSDSLSSFWGHSVHYIGISDKATGPTVFIQFQPNFMESMVIGGGGGTQGITFWRSAKFKKYSGPLKYCFLHHRIWGWKLQKPLLLQFSPDFGQTL